uniref:Uncharacterized protein n=1 Tax=Equus asinus TaxID=9793 RepID=A0A9L0JAL8_EQUAS
MGIDSCRASRAAETTPLPHTQRPERRRAPHHCLGAPQSLVTPGQGYPLSLRTLHLQALIVPGETCLHLESGLLSPPQPIPLNLPGLTTPGRQDPSLQKTPGRLPLRWTTDLRRSQTLTHPGKSTDNAIPQRRPGPPDRVHPSPSLPFSSPQFSLTPYSLPHSFNFILNPEGVIPNIF